MDAAGKDGVIKHVMAVSIRRAVRFTPSGIRARRIWSTIFCGGRRGACRPAAA
jgi:hypothetical protein